MKDTEMWLGTVAQNISVGYCTILAPIFLPLVVSIFKKTNIFRPTSKHPNTNHGQRISTFSLHCIAHYRYLVAGLLVVNLCESTCAWQF